MSTITRLRTTSPSYDEDFPEWALAQAQALRDGRLEDIDWENVAEEIETLGRNARRALESHLEILLAHLLKCLVQPERRTRSWDQTIRTQRQQIMRLIARNPSLASVPEQHFDEGYRDALAMVERETGIDPATLPEQPPFALDQVLDPAFWPPGAPS
jgi:hypothetical protein